MKNSHVLRLLLTAPLWMAACSDDEAEPDPCAGRNISLSASIEDAHEGQADGTITVEATGSSGYTFSLNGGPYQSSPVFEGLEAGNYTVSVRDGDDCSATEQFTVETQPGGNVSFSETISPLIAASCGSCHSQQGQPGFAHANLSDAENIKENATRINTEVQAGRMPKGGSLTDEQKAAIAAWVDAGAPIDN